MPASLNTMRPRIYILRTLLQAGLNSLSDRVGVFFERRFDEALREAKTQALMTVLGVWKARDSPSKAS